VWTTDGLFQEVAGKAGAVEISQQWKTNASGSSQPDACNSGTSSI